MNFKYKIGVIGYGNMASAIISRAIDYNVFDVNDIMICDVDERKTAGLDFNIKVTTKVRDIAENCEFVLLAIKPQISAIVFEQMRDYVKQNKFISIMAGLSSQKIKEQLKNDVCVVRCMPNTPAMVGCAMTAIAYNGIDKLSRVFIDKLFCATGKVVEVEEEDINAVTSVSGSGPAYFYYFIKSVIESGVENGLDYETSKKLALQTVLGTVEMIEKSNESIDVLIDRVCSPNGTTIQAVDCFNDNKLDKIIKQALKKCYDRAVELSK